MTKDEALKLALEALEKSHTCPLLPDDCAEAITAIKEALAQPEQEPVATDWERIARVQNAKLMAMCDEAGGFEKLCEVMDKYERTTPPQRKPLTDEEERKAFEQWYVCNAFDYERNPVGSRECGLQWSAWKARAAHGIKGLV